MILSQQTLCVSDRLHPRRGKKASSLDSCKHPVVDSTVLTSYSLLLTRNPSSICHQSAASPGSRLEIGAETMNRRERWRSVEVCQLSWWMVWQIR